MMKTRRSFFTLASSSVLALALGAGPVFANSWGSSGGSSGGGFLHHGGGSSGGSSGGGFLHHGGGSSGGSSGGGFLHHGGGSSGGSSGGGFLHHGGGSSGGSSGGGFLHHGGGSSGGGSIGGLLHHGRRLQRRILLTSLGYRHWLGGTDGNSVQDIGDDTKSNSQYTRSTHDEDSAVFLHSCLIELSGLGPWGRACVRGFVGFQRRRVPSPQQWWRVQRRWINRRIGAPPPIPLGVVP